MNHADRQYLELLKQCLTASIYDESAWHVREAAEVTKGNSLARPVDFLKRLIHSALFEFRRRKSLLLVEQRAFD